MELGQIVKIKARVDTGYEKDALILGLRDDERSGPQFSVVHKPKVAKRPRCLFRLEFDEPVDGMVIGYTWRATGAYNSGGGDGYGDYDPPYLSEDARYKVWMVATTLRWKQPILALEQDISEC